MKWNRYGESMLIRAAVLCGVHTPCTIAHAEFRRRRKNNISNTCWHQRHALPTFVCFCLPRFFFSFFSTNTALHVNPLLNVLWGVLKLARSVHQLSYKRFLEIHLLAFSTKKTTQNNIGYCVSFCIHLYILGTALITRTFQSRKKSIR